MDLVKIEFLTVEGKYVKSYTIVEDNENTVDDFIKDIGWNPDCVLLTYEKCR